jgi:hypothetical protein
MSIGARISYLLNFYEKSTINPQSTQSLPAPNPVQLPTTQVTAQHTAANRTSVFSSSQSTTVSVPVPTNPPQQMPSFIAEVLDGNSTQLSDNPQLMEELEAPAKRNSSYNTSLWSNNEKFASYEDMMIFCQQYATENLAVFDAGGEGDCGPKCFSGLFLYENSFGPESLLATQNKDHTIIRDQVATFTRAITIGALWEEKDLIAALFDIHIMVFHFPKKSAMISSLIPAGTDLTSSSITPLTINLKPVLFLVNSTWTQKHPYQHKEKSFQACPSLKPVLLNIIMKRFRYHFFLGKLCHFPL